MARILIIEDNPINMKLTSLLVHRAGHSTLGAADAESGLLLARVELPDVILMDVQLPGMDGFAATTVLKNDPVTAEIPVIAVTAGAMSRDQKRAREAGCDAYITKPLHYQELQDTINWLMPRADDETLSDQAGSRTRQVLQPYPSAQPVEPVQATADASPVRVSRGTRKMPAATRILVAEDNPTNQKLILWQLNLLGYSADMTKNGAEALESWETGVYDLVITDLHMPEMNGYELASAIRAAEAPGTRVAILAMTASAVRGDADHTRMVGMNEYLMRPLRLGKLRAALLKWLPLESDIERG
ncbi:response regulator [Cryobacterium sp. PH31-O1]|uniref:response regulator n=1 Tax=Cryobacterium sp. PH31-O1 TaxID=3046306 RepID=UPI0024BAE112|nr:response regulator [Cryobacterium sp. PH31-O1]MDJ0337277.1 response regulator [Cryobacterium sp. PH31-O1]